MVDDSEPTNDQELVSLPESWDAQAPERRVEPIQSRARPSSGGWLVALRPYIYVAGVTSLVVLGVAVWMRVKPQKSRSAPAHAVPTAPTSVSAAPPAPALSASAALSVQPSTQSSTRSPNSRPSDTTACVKSFFPKGTFAGRKPDFSTRCHDRRAYRGMLEIKSELVAAAGKHRISEGMQLWSKLAWYETAAYAYIRERCCSNPLLLKAPKVVSPCQFDRALRAIAESIDDDEALDKALDEYHSAADCVFRSRAGAAFDRWEPVYGGERDYFDKLIGR